MPDGSNAAVSRSDATAQVHAGLANAFPAAAFPNRASSAVPPGPGPNTPNMPSTRTRVPARVNAPRCAATAGMLASQLEHPAATNHTSTGRPSSEARLTLRWSSSISVPTGAAAARWPAERAAGAGAPPVAARTPRAAPSPATAATAAIRAALPARLGRSGPLVPPAESACTVRTSAVTGPARPARLLRRYRLIRRYRRTLSLTVPRFARRPAMGTLLAPSGGRSALAKVRDGCRTDLRRSSSWYIPTGHGPARGQRQARREPRQDAIS